MPRYSATESSFAIVIALVMMYVLSPVMYRLYGLLGAGLLVVLTMLLVYVLMLQFWGALKSDHKTTKRVIISTGRGIRSIYRHFRPKRISRARRKRAIVLSKRVRCLYCGSPNKISNVKCTQCFAPLPDKGTVIY